MPNFNLERQCRSFKICVCGLAAWLILSVGWVTFFNHASIAQDSRLAVRHILRNNSIWLKNDQAAIVLRALASKEEQVVNRR